MLGKILGGRYEIISRLGTGGMAVVYKARCTWLDRTVTVKVLREDLTGDEEFVRRFRREAQAVARLSHPNIVSVYDVGQEAGIYYIVMEYIEGRTLKDLVREQGRLSEAQALDIFLQICAALEHAHENHIIHRDIKPHNILITPRGRVKVTDFGIAQAAAAGATLTHPGKIIGSVHYLSPEQARGEVVGIASDLYSAGAVLYEMLTGKVPFEGESLISVALKHLQDPIVPPRQLEPAISPAVEKVVLKALSKNPRTRFRSAQEMAQSLRAAARNELPEDFLLEEPDRPDWEEQTRGFSLGAGEGRLRRGKRRLRPGFVAVAILAGLLVAVGLYFLGVRLLVVPEVEVPAVTGELLEDALVNLQRAGLQGTVVGQRYSNEVGKNRVLEQNPEANKLVKRGRVVELVVSLGSQLGTVPNVKGKSLTEASILITNAGYAVGTVEPVFALQTPIDEVISQIPAADSQAPLGTAVNLLVSKGPPQQSLLMTNLVGMRLEQAKVEIARLGMVLGTVTERESGEYFVGQVVEQSTPPGTMVLPGATINLVVSKGPGPAPRNATVSVQVPSGGTVHYVVITVDDRKDRRDDYRGAHSPGDSFTRVVRYYGEGKIQVYIDDELKKEFDVR